MHFTGGQPARGSEILSIRHSNSIRRGHRNIFIEKNLMIFVKRAHKGYIISGDVKIIHRYLPRAVGELLAYYLWLLLPLVQSIEVTVRGGQELSPFLWPSDSHGRPFVLERMRHCIKRETRAGMDVELTIRMYREVSIAMSRHWLRRSEAFNKDQEGSDDEDENDEDQIAYEQAGHSRQMAGMVYARHIDDLAGEVATERAPFRKVILAWQAFRGFPHPADQKRDSRDVPFHNTAVNLHQTGLE